MKESNKFQEMVFMTDNSQKLIKSLIQFGYDYIGFHPEYSCHCIYTIFKQNRFGYEKPYYGFCNEQDFYDLPDSGYRRNCGQNPKLFLALAALRKDSNQQYQWFTDNEKHFRLYSCEKDTIDYNKWHKMDSEELIRHFADMEPSVVMPSNDLELQQTVNCLEKFGYEEYNNIQRKENTINTVFIFKMYNGLYCYKLYNKDEYYLKQHDKEMKKMKELIAPHLLKPIAPHLRINDCGNNIKSFLAIAAIKNDTDKYQYFKLDEDFRIDNGMCFFKGTSFINYRYQIDKSIKYAHKMLPNEIMSHFNS